MDNEKYHFLSDLTMDDKDWRIRVRISRVWNTIVPTANDLLLSHDYLFTDEEGMTMQATIKKNTASDLRAQLIEGDIYCIMNFVVVQSNKKYRICESEQMIRLGKWTRVQQLTLAQHLIPVDAFKFIEHGLLMDRVNDDTSLTDFIGKLVSVTELSKIPINGRVSEKKNLIIQDKEMNEVNVTIWGDIAYGLDEQRVKEESKEGAIIMILTSMTVRRYEGKPSLSSTSATKIYVNLNIPEVLLFRNSSAPPFEVIIHPSSMRASSSPVIHKVTIKELLAVYNHRQKQGGKYSCKAKINGIHTNDGWWYNGCPKCQIGVNYNGSQVWCEQCGILRESPIPCYKLFFVVEDETGNTIFSLLGDQADAFIQIPAKTVINVSDEKSSPPPASIMRVCGTEHIFQVICVRPLSGNMPCFKILHIMRGSKDDSVPYFFGGYEREAGKSKEQDLSLSMGKIKESTLKRHLPVQEICPSTPSPLKNKERHLGELKKDKSRSRSNNACPDPIDDDLSLSASLKKMRSSTSRNKKGFGITQDQVDT
ncbi:uncharacterized protein LOC120013903 [Tripterygium wilfordii]|uniref:uncharacterized protein LOC120013903 n=1 Tax=Tripterygium wilfordii TaxID=458696 RepID=UPI0018F85E29|nr:uncharacterized protein LOC120013903 [Tripterygium wilfordii]